MGDMKPSGVEWIAEIPSEWDDCKPLRFCANQSSVIGPYEQGRPYIALDVIDSWTGKLNPIDEAEQVDSTVASFTSSDVLFGKLRPYLAKVVRPSFEGQCSTELLPITPICLTRDYLFWLLLNKGFIDTVNSGTYGVKMPRTSWRQMGAIYCPVPPGWEQQAIAAFLDKKCASIDVAVSTLEKQIVILERYRTSVIHEAVTKGLNPEAPMKSSGIDWCNECPLGWTVLKLKYICNMQSGDAITSESVFEEGKFPVYGGNGLRGYTERFNTVRDSILIGRQGALCGNVHLARAPFWASDHAIVVEEKTQLDRKFFYYQLLSMNLNSLSMTAAQPGISVSTVMGQKVLLPSIEEQRDIVCFLDTRIAAIDSILETKRKQIDVLKRRRQSLIYECVTGKRRVGKEI